MNFVVHKVIHYFLRYTVLDQIKLSSAILEKQLNILEMHVQVYLVQIRIDSSKQMCEWLQHSRNCLFGRNTVNHLNNRFRNKAGQYLADKVVVPRVLVSHHLLYLRIVRPVPVQAHEPVAIQPVLVSAFF